VDQLPGFDPSQFPGILQASALPTQGQNQPANGLVNQIVPSGSMSKASEKEEEAEI